MRGGVVDVEGGSTLTVTGNVTNAAQIYTSFNGTGNNTININGTLTNNASSASRAPTRRLSAAL